MTTEKTQNDTPTLEALYMAQRELLTQRILMRRMRSSFIETLERIIDELDEHPECGNPLSAVTNARCTAFNHLQLLKGEDRA